MSATEMKGTALITGALQSSNSGFQRLSQAGLSRSRFFRLAAGALLPVVGLSIRDRFGAVPMRPKHHECKHA